MTKAVPESHLATGDQFCNLVPLLPHELATCNTDADKGRYACRKLWDAAPARPADGLLVLPNGWALEVKTTARHCALSLKDGKGRDDVYGITKADVLALVWCTAAADIMDVRGVVPRARFLKQARLCTLEHGKQLSLEWERLAQPYAMPLAYSAWMLQPPVQ